MKLVIKTLQLLGFWSHPDCDYNSRRAAFLILSVTVWIELPGVAFIFRHEADFAAAMGCIIAIIVVGFVIPQAAIFMIHRRLLEQTFNEMKSALSEASNDPHRDAQTELRQLETFSTAIFKAYIVISIITSGAYVLAIPFYVLVQYVTTGALPPLRSVFEADFVIFDYQCNLFLWLTTVVVTLVVSLHLVIFLMASHCFFWSLLHNVCGLLKIVSMKTARLDEFTDKVLRHEELLEILHLQETAYRSARAMEKALNVILLILYGMCAIEMCMALTAFSLASDNRVLLLQMVLVLIYMFFHMFIYSLLGTELISTSTLTADAFYATRWYQQRVSDQRNILFALTRSQQMAVLTTGKFFLVNRRTFGMALNSAVQYFQVLRQMYGAQ